MGFFLTVNYFWDLILTHTVSKTGKFQYFVTLISFQWPATRTSKKVPYWKLFVMFQNTVPGRPAALPRLFVPWLSPRVGLGSQNGCLWAEATETRSPHASSYSSFPQQAERPNLNTELLLACCRQQLKMNLSWQQFATHCKPACAAEIQLSDFLFEVKILPAVGSFYGSPALEHRLARSASDLWAVETQTPCDNIRAMYCYGKSACLAGPVGTQVTTCLIKVQ